MPFLNICQSKIPNVTRGPFIRQNLLHVRKYSKTLIRLKKVIVLYGKLSNTHERSVKLGLVKEKMFIVDSYKGSHQRCSI